jgi:hypothetical protein
MHTRKTNPKKEITMPAIAPTAMPTNVAIDLIQKQLDTAKQNVTQTKSIHHSTAQGCASEDDIWKQLEPIYSWVGI